MSDDPPEIIHDGIRYVQYAIDSDEIRAFGIPRSPQWDEVRANHIARHPYCEACGNTNLDVLQCHHKQPFHVDPSLELDPLNLWTLCTDGPAGVNCHFFWGHLGLSWSTWNPQVTADTLRWRSRLKHKPIGAISSGEIQRIEV